MGDINWYAQNNTMKETIKLSIQNGNRINKISWNQAFKNAWEINQITSDLNNLENIIII